MPPHPLTTQSVPIVAASADLAPAAHALAAQWGLALATEVRAPYSLVLTAERLELREIGPDAPGPVFVDFLGGAVGHRHRFGGGRGQPMAKAIGLKPGTGALRVLDLTAGLGRDAFVFATLGCEVTLVERSAVVAALLADGLHRASADPEVAPVVARMQLIHADAAGVLAHIDDATRPDVIYLDPMYPHRERTALVKKEMRALQSLLGEGDDADTLLLPALATARVRVVVKRPDWAPPLAGRAPTLHYPTRSHRFDVYVVKALG